MRKRFTTSILLGLLALAAPPAGATDESVLFPRPSALQPHVAFWTRVYAEVGTDGGLIHDSKHLEVVYEVIRAPRNLSSRTRERRIESAKKRYVKILRRLGGGHRKHLSTEEKRVLSLWPDDVSNETLRAAAGRVRFQLGQAEKFRDGIVRSGAWEPHIRRVFAAEGVPEALTALPHVESSYNPRAYSKVGAAGMWQFTRGTGRRYLRIDSAVDERLDPFLSSEAAAALLRDNYERTGTWPLAITAYNHGSAGMRRAIRQLGTRDIATIVARYKSRSFGFASRNFYCEFLAALDVSRAAERYFGVLEPAAPVDHEVVVLDSYYAPRALAQAFGIDIDLLRELNPALRSTVWQGQKHAPKGYTLRLPRVPERGSAQTVLASVSADQRFARQRPDTNYRVRRGDTLSRIAQRFGVSQSRLAGANGLRNRHRIRVGQVLRIPGRPAPAPKQTATAARSVPKPKAAARTPSPRTATRHRVRSGDTLSRIASQYGVSESTLVRANGLRSRHRIQKGQVLEIPGSSAAAKPAPARVAAVARPPARPEPEAKPTAANEPEAKPTAASEPEAKPTAANEPEAKPTAANEPEAKPTAASEPLAKAAAASEPLAKPAAASEPEPAPVLEATLPNATPSPSTTIAEPVAGATSPIANVRPPETTSPVADAQALASPGPASAPLDSARFTVRKDGSIVVQPEETLGHFAEWLGIPTGRLRRLNGMRYRTPLALGRRLRLDFAAASREVFEQRRLAHHRAIRDEFFQRNRVAGTQDHVLRRGETLWELSRKRYRLPLWLVADFNPDLDLRALHPGLRLRIPQIEPRST